MDPRSTRPLQPWPTMLYPEPAHHVVPQTPGQQMNVVQSSAVGETTPILSHSYFNPATNIQTNVYLVQNPVPATAGISAPLSNLTQRVPHQPPQSHGTSDCSYVNPKQLHRILKRREARQKLIEEIGPAVRGPYFNESRHNHARTRPRGPGGKFLRKEEYRQKKKEEFNDERKKEVVTLGTGDASVAGVSTNRLARVKEPARSLLVPIPYGGDQRFTNDDLTVMAEGTAPSQPHQQNVHGDTYTHSYDTPATSTSSVVTAEIQDFNEFSLAVDSLPPLPHRQESLSSITSWRSTTSSVNPTFHDGSPLPLYTASNTVWNTSCFAENTE